MNHVRDGVTYNYSFLMNIPLVILFMLPIIGTFSAFTARNSTRSIIVTIVLIVLTIIGLCLVRPSFVWVNPFLNEKGLVLAPGFYVSLSSMGVGLVIAVIELIRTISYWKKDSQAEATQDVFSNLPK